MNIHHIVGQEKSYPEYFYAYLADAYDYLWLKTNLNKGRECSADGATLITGSSHALNGIETAHWDYAVNCSMQSQDLYYDFCCAKSVLDHNCHFEKCFIILGYYIAYQDLSRSTNWGKRMMEKVYNPVFHDIHNWTEELEQNPWHSLNGLPQAVVNQIKTDAYEVIYRMDSYYNELRDRSGYFNLDMPWKDLPQETRDNLAACRCADHNHIYKYKDSYCENKQILEQYVTYLHEHRVLPILVIPPFTEEYNSCVLPAMKSDLQNMADEVSQTVHYVDFNEETGLFSADDFMDTDHLSLKGAKKMSSILADMFGK